MSQLKIRKAFEKKLQQITPAIQTAWESVAFTPTQGVPYQRVQLVPFKPENPTYGDNYHREVGEFQVYLCYPNGKGTQEAQERAELLKNTFYRSLTLVQDGVEIVIRRTPAISAGFITNDRYILSVSIEYYASIF